MNIRQNFARMMLTAQAALLSLVGASPREAIETNGNLRRLPLSVRMAAQANINRRGRGRGTKGAFGICGCGGYHARQALRRAKREGREKYLVPAFAHTSLAVDGFQSRQTGGRSRAARARRAQVFHDAKAHYEEVLGVSPAATGT